MTRTADLDALIAATVERFGRLDVLVNNAGGTGPRPALRTSEAFFERALRFNVTAPFLLTQRAARALEVVLTDDRLRATFEDNTPMRRPGTPEDIACAALYLASPASGWVTGKVFQIDGGVERPAILVPVEPLEPS